MIHDPEFPQPAPKKDSQLAKDLAAAFARVFLGNEDGKRVLKHLRVRFGAQRLCFNEGQNGRFDTIAAAITDGERRVLLWIEGALTLGAPDQALSEKPIP